MRHKFNSDSFKSSNSQILSNLADRLISNRTILHCLEASMARESHKARFRCKGLTKVHHKSAILQAQPVPLCTTKQVAVLRIAEY